MKPVPPSVKYPCRYGQGDQKSKRSTRRVEKSFLPNFPARQSQAKKSEHSADRHAADGKPKRMPEPK